MKNKLLLPSLLWGAVFDRDTEGLGPFNGTRNAQATYVTAVPEPSVALMPGAAMIGGSLLGTLELVACRDVQFAQIVGAVVGQHVSLEPGPQILDRIEIRRIGGGRKAIWMWPPSVSR